MLDGIFYFYNAKISNGITSRNDAIAKRTFEYMKAYVNSCVSLNDALVAAGAIVVTDAAQAHDVTLAPEALAKGTIINLLTI